MLLGGGLIPFRHALFPISLSTFGYTITRFKRVKHRFLGEGVREIPKWRTRRSSMDFVSSWLCLRPTNTPFPFPSVSFVPFAFVTLNTPLVASTKITHRPSVSGLDDS